MKHFAVAGAPHLPARSSVQRVMGDVLLALLPGIATHVLWFGPGVLLQIALACLFALAIEALCLRWRGLAPAPFLCDGSALVTATLFALCIPPLCPWWISAGAMLVAIGLAKHAYGGLGHNLFNPAMAGYAAVLLAFPYQLSTWLAPAALAGAPIGLADALHTILLGQLPPHLQWDTLASATPLGSLRNAAANNLLLGEVRVAPLFGSIGGRGWEWIALAYAAGGLYLLARRVVRWQVPVAVLGSSIVLLAPFWLLAPDTQPSPLLHLVSGGLMLGAWFIAADPVTGCTAPRGRLLFGAGVAALTLAIRQWGGYADGMAFAVLLMNALAPLLDQHTRPRVFGQGQHD